MEWENFWKKGLSAMFRIEEINLGRIEELLEILRERAKWLESLGLPMWNEDI